MNKYRTHTCGELTKDHKNKEISLSGWINKKRDHGNLLFLDLRDNYGITQCVIQKNNSNFTQLEKLSLTLSLNSQNYDLIKKFEKELSNLDLVSNYYIDNFSSQMTIYKIIYNGTPDKFIQEIENNGLKLDTSFRIWRIQWKI